MLNTEGLWKVIRCYNVNSKGLGLELGLDSTTANSSETFLELVDTSSGVNKLLLPRKEWVCVRGDT